MLFRSGIDNIVLAISLVVQELLHTMGIEAPGLTQHNVLVTQDMLHAMGIDNVTISPPFVVQDMHHAMFIDGATVTVPAVMRYWNGSAWVLVLRYYWDGDEWIPT